MATTTVCGREWEHAFAVGSRVTVFNRTLSGKLIIEGASTVRQLMPADHTYRVHFDADLPDQSFAYTRRVEPGPSQDDPAAYLADQSEREERRSGDHDITDQHGIALKAVLCGHTATIA